MRSVGSHSMSGREKEGNKERTGGDRGNFYKSIKGPSNLVRTVGKLLD